MTKEQAIKKYNLKETGHPVRIARAVRETKTLRIVYDLYKTFEGDDVPYFLKIWRYRGDVPFGHSRTIEITEWRRNGMNSKTTEQKERASAAEWYECVRHEARGALILHGIEQPTERQIAAYILFGEKSLNGRTV